MLQLDYQLFQWINGLAVKLPLFNPLIRFLAEDAEYLFYIGVLIYWLIRTEANRRMIVEAMTSACIALGLSGLIGMEFYRDRPFVAHQVIQLIHHAANASFPSDHAIGAFVIATSIWLTRKKEGSVWFVLAAGIGLSRIWAGVHYPSDILAGAAIGGCVAGLVHVILTKLRWAQKAVQFSIKLYEGLENKIWPNKRYHNTHQV
ncbi:undecaprenyl-diphosphatase [Paenibacillus cremeus]|uniref:Undecaprenyl-diphosphatase n=1 Tax=Paenibacillus cremeus TaxID=2163881 RepID=A0A559K9S1_9BACL|nr:undecaprenyl-diphosphatase [Paenibacillus cremeus]TVY08878.1 undecaprenyl-diphosphatase [Paenibacillus cremeus]